MNVVFSDSRPTDPATHVIPIAKGAARAGSDGAVDAGLDAAAAMARFEGRRGSWSSMS